MKKDKVIKQVPHKCDKCKKDVDWLHTTHNIQVICRFSWLCETCFKKEVK